MLSILLLATSAAALASPRWVMHAKRAAAPAEFTRRAAAPPDAVLSFRLNLAMRDREGLARALNAASSPDSASFRQWLTKDEVEAFARPSNETTEAVREWLASHGVEPQAVTQAGDWLAFSAPVKTANAMFNAHFDVFQHGPSGQEIIRTLELSLPAHLEDAIRSVTPAVSFTGPGNRRPVLSDSAKSPPTADSTHREVPVPANCTQVVPRCLQEAYDIPTAAATNANNVLGVSGFYDQFANKADLKDWLRQYRPDMDPNTTFNLTSVDGGVNDQNRTEAGGEANLDIQYTVGIATGVPVTFVSVGETNPDNLQGYLDIILALLNQTEPPTVLTTSYGFDTEDTLDVSDTVSICDAYMQLTSRGTSILFASGDGGVASTPGVECTPQHFRPTFPSCPYVTLVGSTQGFPEVGADFTAGGFSNYFPQQDWQADAVNAYIESIGDLYDGAYNKTGRAYPDISAQGFNVLVETDGFVQDWEGTSLSSPIVSSVIALLNDELISAGKPVLGFLNPWLYANPQAFNDITTGQNPGCNTTGFPAKVGWDPVTGMGTPNYTALRKAAGL